MNPNLSSNMMSHMTVGPQQTSVANIQSFGPQMTSNVNQNIVSQMDCSPIISSTINNSVTSQTLSTQTSHSQQSQQTSQPMSAKDVNTAYLCRIGDETVQEIVTKTSELFQLLRTMSPPNGTQQSVQQQEDKKLKVKELLKTIEFHFKRLRKFYERCNECCAQFDYIQIESLIPMKDKDFAKIDDKKFNNNKVKQLDKEHQELVDLLQLKNRQIKEVIDNLRSIVWEINTMLAMRKP